MLITMEQESPEISTTDLQDNQVRLTFTSKGRLPKRQSSSNRTNGHPDLSASYEADMLYQHGYDSQQSEYT